MKRFFWLPLCVLLFAACGSDEPDLSSPEAVVAEYQLAILKMDFAKARSLVTPESSEVIDYVESFQEMFDDLGFEEENMDSAAEDLICEIKGENAVCTFTDSYGEKQSINVVLRAGKWLLDIRMPKMDDIQLNTDDTESILDSLLEVQ